MKLIDTFLFSEPFESEVLLIKLILAGDRVAKWILIENAYTFQGDYKGLFAQGIIDGDERFKPYRDRIQIISADLNILDSSHGVSDQQTFQVEYWQRDLATENILQLDDDDWVFVSDSDEAIDLTDEKRYQEVLTQIASTKGEKVLAPTRKRYWFDFDNEYKNLGGIPLVPVRLLRKGLAISEARKTYTSGGREKWKNIIVFEYSHCFTMDQIARKYKTFAHVGISPTDIMEGLKYNQRILKKEIKSILAFSDQFFFWTIPLNEYNSPQYVRDHLSSLKTNVIDPQYKKNRRVAYPHLFHVMGYLKYYLLHPLLKKFR